MVALPLPELPEEVSALRILALDLRWTWSHEHDAFWERIDPRLWRRTKLTASGTFSETKTETPEGRPASVCEIARNSDPLRGGSCACLCQLLPVPDGTFVCR